ncbi:MAG: [NiFe]-hydrogenase assembly chaperone HybE, partial [Enterobacterales bacterium]|nr:[NiFe]-hydrogenase assembly chaperone HybE [Enterobacterales bacterium]
GELPKTGQLLSCSLMSPIEPHISADEGKALVADTLKMLLSLPVQDEATPVSVSRRELFLRKR